MQSILTITTPAAAAQQRLCTLVALKSELGITDTASDVALEQKIDEASGAIADYCQRVFAQESASEAFRLSQSVKSLSLSRWPVSAIASVTIDGAAVDDAAYEVDPANGLLWRIDGDQRSAWAHGRVVVAYTAGYALPAAAPSALSRACILLASTWWQGRGRDATIRSESTDGVDNVSYFDPRNGGGALPSAVTDPIERYRATAV
ncbi:phage head-tail connector protein [Falsiroseomonas sp.]|uniref:phage head-tail connector protein n=1 Tax=Falsiroseomonas sp. TaxID=2870721 RepID=UPI002733CEC9|nr:phage head-tail connector protein [Falsiroseomonas sp.]MDP3417856.1 phage head-tail connector protein [Falsiroseomonas sp.]